MENIKFLLRMDKNTHIRIHLLAKQKYMSMNAIINLAIQNYYKQNNEIMISDNETNLSDGKTGIYQILNEDKIKNKTKGMD